MTDRDVVVRALAAGDGPDTPVRRACSADLVTVAPDDDVAADPGSVLGQASAAPPNA